MCFIHSDLFVWLVFNKIGYMYSLSYWLISITCIYLDVFELLGFFFYRDATCPMFSAQMEQLQPSSLTALSSLFCLICKYTTSIYTGMLWTLYTKSNCDLPAKNIKNIYCIYMYMAILTKCHWAQSHIEASPNNNPPPPPPKKINELNPTNFKKSKSQFDYSG